MVSNVAYSVSSMVRDYHEYLHVWDAAIGEVLPYSNEDGNLHDPYAVAGELSPVKTKATQNTYIFLNVHWSTSIKY